MDVIDDLTDIAEGYVRKLLTGSAEDLHRYALSIAADMAKVAFVADKDKKKELMAELVAQLQAVGEINRIRATRETWAVFEEIMSAVGQTLLAVALKAVP